MDSVKVSEVFDPSRIVAQKLSNSLDENDNDQLFMVHLVGDDGTFIGRITVLDRVTGYSFMPKDIETGFKDADGKFWLSSGNVDVRVGYKGTSWLEAIAWIKARANNCMGE